MWVLLVFRFFGSQAVLISFRKWLRFGAVHFHTLPAKQNSGHLRSCSRERSIAFRPGIPRVVVVVVLVVVLVLVFVVVVVVLVVVLVLVLVLVFVLVVVVVVVVVVVPQVSSRNSSFRNL